jgi:hypothetical protein
MNRQAFVSGAVGGGVATNLDSVTNTLTARDSCPRAVSALLNTITQKTRLGARGERGDAGLAKEKRSSRLGPQRGQRKSLAKQKAGAKKIAKALNRTPGATTVKAHMHMLDVSLSTRGT